MILWILLLALCSESMSAVAPEYQIKAPALYHFLNFTVWPDGIPAHDGQSIIGIVGKDPFGDYLKPIEKKSISGNKIVINRYGKFNDNQDFSKLSLLFISTSERRNLKPILEKVKGSKILTVSETDNFLELGGMINFINVKGKVNFEINQAAADETGIRIRSELLGRAHKVIHKKKLTDNTKGNSDLLEDSAND